VLETPVLFLIYDRPELTRRVFERIREARPRRLWVVADGPRDDVPGDAERCAAARAVVDAADWPVEIQRDFAERNLGCKRRVASGIDAFFRAVERGIVLEDDCLPHPSFFAFCERLLDRYADDERVMHVSGSCFTEARAGGASYSRSVYPTIWGWASWRRAWRHYDLSLSGWPEFRRAGRLEALFPGRLERTFWEDTLDRTYRGEIDTWDHAWTFAVWRRGGVALVPTVNLVENIGAGGGAHMRGRGVPPPLDPRGIDPDALRDPATEAIDRDADTRTLRAFLRFFSRRARLRLAWRTLRRSLAGAPRG
jgi:hypothetical protein